MIHAKKYLLLGWGLLTGLVLTAQSTTVNFTSTGTMQDAFVGNGGIENTNFGSQDRLNVFYDKSSTIAKVFRSFISYDLSSIPANAIIVDAKLKLVTHTVNNTISHPIYVQRVNQSWSSSTVTWNNQPSVITSDQLSFTHAQTSGTGTHQLNVTAHVQKMVKDPTTNQGWRIRLQSESGASTFGLMYHSSEATSSGNRPVLTVEYVLPLSLTPTVSHCTPGNSDGSFSVAVGGGSSITLGDVYFYKTVRDTTQLGNATLVNAKTTNNVQYNATTKKITATNLSPGVYLLRVYDSKYYVASNPRLTFNLHILVGREGEITKGILMPHETYQENMTISRDKPSNSSPTDRINTNYYSGSAVTLRASASPNVYEYAALIKYDMDFDYQLDITKAELRMKAFGSGFARYANSSNAVNYSVVTSPWTEEDVTWNIRPTIDSTQKIQIATTTYMGYDPVHNWDTISLIPFVEYWSENPTENYGFEIALQNYNASQFAAREYLSAAGNVNFMYFEFSVKPKTVATYNEETERGTIEVTAPNGYPLPYKYLLSYSPLPTLNTIWTSIKDSIPIDSATFFAGNTSTRTFTFEDLDAERYYVGVYDNTGTKILDSKSIVAPPIELLDNSNIVQVGDVLKRGSSGSSGSAIINGKIEPSENGGVEFQVKHKDGNVVMGFYNATNSKPALSSDFMYAIELYTDNTFDVLKLGAVLFSGNVETNDIFRIQKVNNEVIFYLNQYELIRTSIAVSERNVLGGGVIYRTPSVEISGVTKLEHYKPKIKPITSIPFNLECGDLDGKLRGAIALPAYYGGTGTYVVRDAVTEAIIISGPISDILIDGIELPLGEYKINYSYVVGGITYNFVDYFSIANQIYWNVLNEHFELTPGIFNTLLAEGTLLNGMAMSQNNLGFPQTGWVKTHVDFRRFYGPWEEPDIDYVAIAHFQMVNQSLEAQVQLNIGQIGPDIITKFVWVTGHETEGFYTYKNGPFKIERVPTWDYEVSFNNSLSPFSTVTEVETDPNELFYLYAEGRNCMITESSASFCGFESIRSYADLTRKLDGGYYLAQNGIVKFIYNEEYADEDGELTYKIFDASNEIVVSHTTLTEDVVFGDNRFDMDFSSFTDENPLSNGVYVLEVTNEKNEKWYLRFKIINN